MPVSIVVGGQYGSEGKGKVVHHFAKEFKVKAAVKVSGTNSGHTFIDEDGKAHIHRVLPSASTLPGVHSIIPAGAVFDPELLFKEMEEADLSPSSVYIHPNAGIITEEIKQEEKWSGPGIFHRLCRLRNWLCYSASHFGGWQVHARLRSSGAG